MRANPLASGACVRAIRIRQHEEVAGLVRAVWNTTRRYEQGLMTRGTWRSHLGSLWGAAQAAGVEAEVRAALAHRARLAVGR